MVSDLRLGLIELEQHTARARGVDPAPAESVDDLEPEAAPGERMPAVDRGPAVAGVGALAPDGGPGDLDPDADRLVGSVLDGIGDELGDHDLQVPVADRGQRVGESTREGTGPRRSLRTWFERRFELHTVKLPAIGRLKRCPRPASAGS